MRRVVLAVGLATLLVLVVTTLVGGSPDRLAAGTTIAGLPVGGLELDEAVTRLERRSSSLQREPLTFVAGGRSLELTASQLGVRPDWAGAVTDAAAASDGFGPFRGIKRIQTRLVGVEIEPRVAAYPSVVRYSVSRLAAAVDRPAVDATVRRAGLRVTVTPARSGVWLDRDRATATVVASLAMLERDGSVRLPLVTSLPRVTGDDLAPAARAAEIALSAPVRLQAGPMTFRLARWEVAGLLRLPTGGRTETTLDGPRTRRWLGSLARTVSRAPRDAIFRVVPGGIEVVPSQPGRAVDLGAARTALGRAVFSETNRVASVVPAIAQPERTTAEAKAMGISGVVGSYTTTYGGTPGRLHNVGLVAELIDGALVAPGERFSFNETTGERNEAKGFAEAPVIINGELRSGIGGGVCQVSTTVFNAAFEAGLSIERRTNHALYIDHYPLGRDATVNYPDLDLVFRNDTDRWLLLRAFVGAGSLTVNLYGTPQGRRVETETAPLDADGKVPWKRIDDAELYRGEKVVERFGVPPRSTSVTRRVFAANGTLMYDTTWRSYYVGEPTVVRLGTKPRPQPVAPEPSKAKASGARAALPAAGVTGAESVDPPRPTLP